MFWKAIAAITPLVLCSACLLKDEQNTLYLSPDGSLEWVVLETNVRSDSQSLIEREREEQEFLEKALRGENEAALRMRALGGWRVESQVLRAERPYDVITSARFDSIADLFRSASTEEEVPSEIEMENDGEITRLILHFGPFPAEEDASNDKSNVEQDLSDEGSSEEQNVSEGVPFELLVGEDLRIILTDGHFLDAEGFQVSASGDMATLPDQAVAPGEIVTLSLTWLSAGDPENR